eukprot:CAMPEP_0202854080 /NCGR_PEP_ID=MMETSP1389-20130828/90815_1 /ASSEMBLY_ACC=CAM_ASM_000865 /TAXON_ID=302021 /ORGANISM="Rhodomonas sp., Strain CCMP768" /LENGTH=197 /DNA_ID=CAMNT_0049532655 /DNA_START=330 /DNA_END=924 /DNA_ORIENTATION=+
MHGLQVPWHVSSVPVAVHVAVHERHRVSANTIDTSSLHSAAWRPAACTALLSETLMRPCSSSMVSTLAHVGLRECAETWEAGDGRRRRRRRGMLNDWQSHSLTLTRLRTFRAACSGIEGEHSQGCQSTLEAAREAGVKAKGLVSTVPCPDEATEADVGRRGAAAAGVQVVEFIEIVKSKTQLDAHAPPHISSSLQWD